MISLNTNNNIFLKKDQTKSPQNNILNNDMNEIIGRFEGEKFTPVLANEIIHQEMVRSSHGMY